MTFRAVSLAVAEPERGVADLRWNRTAGLRWNRTAGLRCDRTGAAGDGPGA
ncbi:hypothetical protein [Streptomyces sp.]|uniref:hypothetical protein n=1 Tax=Streptomyces sp. TaxID=1931 RepID=UPI002D38E5AE|nr:hypothetical protein [Streptomyces sp.]HZF90923.1 hypothetical protein [Streptomyces sp.]